MERKLRGFHPLPLMKPKALLFLSVLLLAKSGDIEVNPGPCAPKHPCQICDRAVTWKHRAVSCDDCLQWYHVDCMHLSSAVYNVLGNSNVSWHCVKCGLPQFSSSLFNSATHVTSSNAFDALSSLSSSNSSLSSEHLSEPGSPLATSSPARKKCSRKEREKTVFSTLTINFQSIKNKKEEVGALIDSANPDIIIGTETWLKPEVHSSEIFPVGYNVIRRDRQDRPGGGVLIAIKDSLSFQQLSSDVQCENVFIKVSLSGRKSLVIGALYRPPSSDTSYLEAVCSLVERICEQNKNSIIWIGGDLNLPGIDWETLTSDSQRTPAQLSGRFIEMIHSCNLKQMVDFTTRNENILDLFMTNRPSLVSECKPLPGLGDHDIVMVYSRITPQRTKPVKRKIYLWKRAEVRQMKEKCISFSKSFTSRFNSDSSISDMWLSIKSNLLDIQDQHVPSKMSSVRYNQP
nr:uncharacterized protein LOC129269612 [Lytechinus pictus]